MPEKDKKFHEFALKSILFKGQHDLYFCYIKSEKIAQVLSLLQARSSVPAAEQMGSLVAGSSRLPETIAHFAAGEMELAVVLADIFSLLSAVRLGSLQGFIYQENAALIAEEYAALAERLAGGGRLSPFVTSEDFLLPPIQDQEDAKVASLLDAHTQSGGLHVKDIKGQYKGQQKDMRGTGAQGQRSELVHRAESKRSLAILSFVRKHTGTSIKDISRVIKDCSEKTIQRELTLLIEQGLVEKRGERRWSVYYPI